MLILLVILLCCKVDDRLRQVEVKEPKASSNSFANQEESRQYLYATQPNNDDFLEFRVLT